MASLIKVNEPLINACDATIAANSTVAYTLGITVDAADLITVYASSATMSFTAFGSEIA